MTHRIVYASDIINYRSSFIPGLHDVCMVFEKAPTRT